MRPRHQVTNGRHRGNRLSGTPSISNAACSEKLMLTSVCSTPRDLRFVGVELQPAACLTTSSWRHQQRTQKWLLRVHRLRQANKSQCLYLFQNNVKFVFLRWLIIRIEQLWSLNSTFFYTLWHIKVSVVIYYFISIFSKIC